MKYFENCQTLDDLKAAYRAAALANHPDRGGDTAAMQEINAEYETRFNEPKAAQVTGQTTTEVPADFITIISELIRLDGLEVELCGRWLWIGGNTFRHKDALKAAGCRWCKHKGLWSWHHAEEGDHRSRGRKDMDDIRSKYGSKVFSTSAPSSLPA